MYQDPWMCVEQLFDKLFDEIYKLHYKQSEIIKVSK